MGWVDKPHRCQVPLSVYFRVKAGKWWECEHCKLNWQVQAAVLIDPDRGEYGLTFVRREGDMIHTISWQEALLR